MKKLIFIAILPVFFVSGCSTTQVNQPNSLELQAIQARTIEADKRTVYNSTLSILQDIGYIIVSSNFDSGFITADSPTKDTTSFFTALAGGASNSKTSVTASIEDYGTNKTRVRFNFVNKNSSSSAYGKNSSADTPIYDPKIYQNAFEKLEEAVFIRTKQR